MPGLHQISLAYAEPGESAAWSEAFTEGCGENAGVHFSNICIDITAPDVSKAAGMTHLLELRRWSEAKEVLVIGDDMNDLPMIRHFNGHAVANAAPEVRGAAPSVENPLCLFERRPDVEGTGVGGIGGSLTDTFSLLY